LHEGAPGCGAKQLATAALLLFLRHRAAPGRPPCQRRAGQVLPSSRVAAEVLNQDLGTYRHSFACSQIRHFNCLLNRLIAEPPQPEKELAPALPLLRPGHIPEFCEQVRERVQDGVNLALIIDRKRRRIRPNRNCPVPAFPGFPQLAIPVEPRHQLRGSCMRSKL